MHKLIKLVAIIILLTGCVALPELPDVPAPTPQIEDKVDYINPNPDMVFGGGCQTVEYQEGIIVHQITQCHPDGYEVYDEANRPMPIAYTGATYSIYPFRSRGATGFVLPEMRLDEGCYLLKASGFSHMYGNAENYWIGAAWKTPAMENETQMNTHPLAANGEYTAVFVMDAPARNDYTLIVYLWIQYATSEDDSFFTISSISLEAVPVGFCG